MRVSVHIGTLVLDGLELSGPAAERLRGSLTSELARRIEGGVMPLDATAIAAPPVVPSIAVGRGERPEALGSHVASAVAAVFGGSPATLATPVPRSVPGGRR